MYTGTCGTSHCSLPVCSHSVCVHMFITEYRNFKAGSRPFFVDGVRVCR